MRNDTTRLSSISWISLDVQFLDSNLPVGIVAGDLLGDGRRNLTMVDNSQQELTMVVTLFVTSVKLLLCCVAH